MGCLPFVVNPLALIIVTLSSNCRRCASADLALFQVTITNLSLRYPHHSTSSIVSRENHSKEIHINSILQDRNINFDLFSILELIYLALLPNTILKFSTMYLIQFNRKNNCPSLQMFLLL